MAAYDHEEVEMFRDECATLKPIAASCDNSPTQLMMYNGGI